MAVVDMRRFILCEQGHQQGVEMHCLDCQSAFDHEGAINPIFEWPLNVARLDEAVDAAQAHEEQYH